MKDFNLIISTGNTFEQQAECEIWFNLVSLGDENPISYKSGVPGIVFAKTSLDPKEVVHYIENILTNHSKSYCQFIKKIVPVEKVVETDLELIQNSVKDLVSENSQCQDPNSKYRITIRKRRTNLETSDIITKVAQIVDHEVSLKEFDWNIQIEVIGNLTGIAIITDKDILSPTSPKYGFLKKVKETPEF